MTLVIAWVRALPDGYEELVIASDSRIRSGGSLDSAPKVLPLPRNDSVIAFAGDTYFAYPLLLQLLSAVNAYLPMRSRAVDYSKLKSHTLNVFNSMVAGFATEVPELEKPRTEFVLAGYSWRLRRFEVDVISFNPGTGKYQSWPSFKGIGNFGKIMHAGDWRKPAMTRLYRRLIDECGEDAVKQGSTLERKFDMEPFENLRDLLRESAASPHHKASSIGGPPQVVRVTPYLECRINAVFWPDRASGQISYGGRQLLSHESVDAWVLDPDTLDLSHPRFPSTRDSEKEAREDGDTAT